MSSPRSPRSTIAVPIGGDGIVRARNEGRVVIAPFDPGRVRSASYVLSLGRRFRRWRTRKEPIVMWSSHAARTHLEAPVAVDANERIPQGAAVGRSPRVVDEHRLQRDSFVHRVHETPGIFVGTRPKQVKFRNGFRTETGRRVP